VGAEGGIHPDLPGAAMFGQGRGGLRSRVTAASFRSDAKHRTMVRNCAAENFEIPGCAIAHLRFGPSDHTGMTDVD